MATSDLPTSDDDEIPAPRPKKPNGGKKTKKKTIVLDSDLSSDDQVIKTKPKKINLPGSIQVDTDMEEIETKKETPEEELSKFW